MYKRIVIIFGDGCFEFTHVYQKVYYFIIISNLKDGLIAKCLPTTIKSEEMKRQNHESTCIQRLFLTLPKGYNNTNDDMSTSKINISC